MKIPANLVTRALALCFSGGLFVFAIARAQLGCARQSTEVTGEVTAEDPTSPSASSGVVSTNAVPAASTAASASAAARPQASAAAGPTASASAKPTATGMPERAPTWFPASKAGDFRPQPSEPQQQNANQAPPSNR